MWMTKKIDKELEKLFYNRVIFISGHNHNYDLKSSMTFLAADAKLIMWLEFMGLIETAHFICFLEDEMV